MFGRNKNADTEFQLGEKLYYYYKFPAGEPYNGQEGVVSFYVDRIYVERIITKERVVIKEGYEGARLGANYYGIADGDMCARSMTDLTRKLLEKGYSLQRDASKTAQGEMK